MPAEDAPPPPRLVATTVHGRHFAVPPTHGSPRRWLVGFHGYGQDAGEFLELMRRTPGADGWLVVSVQGLHPFYTSRDARVVANWMTRQDREHAIADNVAYVDRVLADLAGDFGTPRALVFAGFSQGVAMAYRAALLGRHPAAAILAVGGDLPPELRMRPGPWPSVRIVAGTRDTFYTPQRVRDDLAFLEALGVGATATSFDGGHEWSADVAEAAGALLARLAAADATPGP